MAGLFKDDPAYYKARAEAEIRLAEKASDLSAAKAHYVLAGLYLDRVYGGAQDSAESGRQNTIPLANEKDI